MEENASNNVTSPICYNIISGFLHGIYIGYLYEPDLHATEENDLNNVTSPICYNIISGFLHGIYERELSKKTTSKTER